MQDKQLFGTFTDPRDGQVYKTVKIGGLEWLAENFRYECEESCVYDNDNMNFKKYGCLYTWEAAMNVAPPGWHLPDIGEWRLLGNFVSDQTNTPKPIDDAYTRFGDALRSKSWKIKKHSKDIWGSDLYGFNALPAGTCWKNTGFHNIGKETRFWSSSEVKEERNCAHSGCLEYEDFENCFDDKKDLLSVRLIRDYTVIARDRKHLEELLDEAFCKRGDECDLNFIDVSNVTDMSDLFCIFNYNANISKWNTKNVTDMSRMFIYSDFDGDISNWDTSSVTNMERMFEDAVFNGDISKWNTKNVTNTKGMFYHSDFDGDLSQWDTSNVTDMSEMFAYSCFNGDISNWNTSCVTNMERMFEDAAFNGDISKWEVSNVKKHKFIFWGGSIVKSHKPRFSRKKINLSKVKWGYYDYG